MQTKSRKKPSVDKVRQSIEHPVLAQAYDADWYYPWQLPPEAKKEKCVQRAIKEGWAEWIESEEDLVAVRAGYVFDLSRDKQGRPIYWLDGHWHRYQGKGASRRLVKIAYEDDADIVGYCGAGDHMCRFCESTLNFTKDPLAGKPYRFLIWQRKLCMTAYGWIIKTESNGRVIRYRRFNEVFVEVPKKNAKSDLGSVIAVYQTRADFVNKAYVYGCASDRKQAAIVFREAVDYVNKSEFLHEEMQVVESRSKIVHLESGSFYEAISGDAARNDGHDASTVIFDELHRQRNRKFYVVMKRAGRARRGKFLRLVITTYGETFKGIWGEEHQKAKSQLSGRKPNYRRLVMIASAEPITVTTTQSVDVGATRIPVWRLEQPIDVGELLKFESSGGGIVETKLVAPAKRYQRFIECEPLTKPLPGYSEATANTDWRSDHAIRRANPAVGIIFPIEDIREDINDATSPESEAEVKQLSLNIVSGGGRRWLSGAAWQNCARHKILMSSLIGQRCYGGIDFSFSNDLTAFWLAFPNWAHTVKFAKVKKPLIRLIGLVWVPEEGIEEREEREEVPYRALSEMPYIGPYGFVRICKGATIDFAQVGFETIDLCSRFKVQAIGYDPSYSQFVVDPYLDPAGLKCIPHRQGAISMGPPTKRFDSLVKNCQIAHGSHPMLDNAIDGAVLHTPDKVGNRYPSKDKSLSRIDPLIAAIMATGWACDPPVELKGTGAWSGKGTGAWE